MRNRYALFTLPLIVGIAAAMPGCSGGASPGDRDATKPGSESEDLFGAKKLLWPGGSVNVCFEPSETSLVFSESLVQWWVTNSWQVNSQLSFHGWGECDTESPGDGIRIVFQDVRPHTVGFGTQIAGVHNGMVLNNTYQNVGTMPGTDWTTMLAWVSVHEFGHALGFMHEQDRPDAPSSALPGAMTIYGISEATCIQQYVTNTGQPAWYDESAPTGALTPLGFYDHVGVMNYCNAALRYANNGVLSIGDLAGLQQFYGAPKGTSDVNDGANPVSSALPLSTVNLITQGNLHQSCTGIVLSTNATTTKILTAAHCKVNATTTVQFFPTTAGNGAKPIATVLNASATTPVAIPPGIVCDPDTAQSFPTTCMATYADGSNVYADLAVLTVDAPVPAGYVAAPLGASGTLSKATSSTSAWEAGTGWGGSMQWGPVELNSTSDAGGFVVLSAPFQQEGDSGGPVFQYVDSSLTSANGLVLLALASQIGTCTKGTQSCDSHTTTYTSLTDASNYTWLVSQGGAPAAPAPTSSGAISSFGAAL